ncbi:NF-kappa-B inhibitor-interacting Ras-like protein 2 isoform X1 [Pontoporia blainvillei]|nr:NF-kappa-B inhibitor-interacting Ras-like protein 2 isoform X1 [Pontoporia blainvillei]
MEATGRGQKEPGRTRRKIRVFAAVLPHPWSRRAKRDPAGLLRGPQEVVKLSMGKSCKVVVCGQASVGKTSILEQLLYGNHVVGSEMIETQEDIYVGSIETDRGVREQVRFYDTRGLRDGAELPRHCFSCTDGYVLVYSTDSRESFQRVELLKKEIDKSKDKKEVTIVVLGNKCDLQEQRRVDPDVAQHWAKSEKVKLWEVSVADRRSLLEPFVYLASRMTQPQSKSAFPLSRKNKGSGSLDG